MLNLHYDCPRIWGKSIITLCTKLHCNNLLESQSVFSFSKLLFTHVSYLKRPLRLSYQQKGLMMMQQHDLQYIQIDETQRHTWHHYTPLQFQHAHPSLVSSEYRDKINGSSCKCRYDFGPCNVLKEPEDRQKLKWSSGYVSYIIFSLYFVQQIVHRLWKICKINSIIC